MERQAVPSHTIDYLVWVPPKNKPPILSTSLSHSMAICDTLYKSPSLVSVFRPLTHLFHNSQFPPGQDICLYRIAHFMTSIDPLLASHCISKLNMPASERFCLHQIRHFLLSIWEAKLDPPRITTKEKVCSEFLDQRRVYLWFMPQWQGCPKILLMHWDGNGMWRSAGSLKLGSYTLKNHSRGW